MKGLCLQITLRITRQLARKDVPIKKKKSSTPLPGELLLPFDEINKHHT